MKKIRLTALMLVLMLLAIAVGCGGNGATPQETPTPTVAEQVTPTKTERPTSSPTPTPEPWIRTTDTPIPTPPEKTDVVFTIGEDADGKVITNKVSDINLWNYLEDWATRYPVDVSETYFSEKLPFAEYIHFMTGTGGGLNHDLFVSVSDLETLDDYKFDKLINACKKVVRQGLKPYIKTGAVPVKYSGKGEYGGFGVNTRPPENYDAYYDYIYNIAKALVEQFGLEEVKTWRWGCLTEFENADWFHLDRDPVKSRDAFCKMYDYTVAALQDAICEDIEVGAHAMAVSEGLWDEREFIYHCANGTNYKTGEIGTRITFISASFYDHAPGNYSKFTLAKTINHLRDAALSVGLTNLKYGVDEGRFLVGTDGKDLTARTVGYTFQAAYDAKTIKTMIEEDIAYFSAWCYTSEGIWEGLPNVTMHVANLFYKMVGSKLTSVDIAGKGTLGDEIDGFSAYNEDEEKLYFMAYNFNEYMIATNDEWITAKIPVSYFPEGVTVTNWTVDDNSNYFDDFQREREKFLNIQDYHFAWSKDSDYTASLNTIGDSAALKRFRAEYDYYYELARLKPVTVTLTPEDAVDGYYTIDAYLDHHAVVLLECEKVK
ncbi:MAG: hypothetical protein E7491_02675 [Ruminococcaceae bacterium]|nr:hypothetical protein [Oscillospiraceae bacterium]